MKDPVEIFLGPLSGFQLLLLICWIEVKTGVMVGDYFYCSLMIVYVALLITWKNMIRPGRN